MMRIEGYQSNDTGIKNATPPNVKSCLNTDYKIKYEKQKEINKELVDELNDYRMQSLSMLNTIESDFNKLKKSADDMQNMLLDLADTLEELIKYCPAPSEKDRNKDAYAEILKKARELCKE